MNSIFWEGFSIGILIILVLIAGIFVYLYSKKKIPIRRPDYYSWFVIGLCWVGAGIVLWISSNGVAFFIMGLILMILGLSHKKEWKKNHLRWKDLTPAEKRFKVAIMILLGILVLAGLVAFLLFKDKIL